MENFGELVKCVRNRFNKKKEEDKEKIKNQYFMQIEKYLLLDRDLPVNGLICIVSITKYKPTEPIDDIMYVELNYFDMIVQELQRKGLRLTERITYKDCGCGCNCSCDNNIKTGYNIYIE